MWGIDWYNLVYDARHTSHFCIGHDVVVGLVLPVYFIAVKSSRMVVAYSRTQPHMGVGLEWHYSPCDRNGLFGV